MKLFFFQKYAPTLSIRPHFESGSGHLLSCLMSFLLLVLNISRQMSVERLKLCHDAMTIVFFILLTSSFTVVQKHIVSVRGAHTFQTPAAF